jgi:haloalkane dehalogenase
MRSGQVKRATVPEVEQLLAKRGLEQDERKVVLVLHDWGSALGLDWARRREECVRGLVLMEFITRVPTWLDFPERGRDRFKAFRTPGAGRERIIEKNEFVKQILPASIVRPLSDAEMKEYRAPFLEPKAP